MSSTAARLTDITDADLQLLVRIHSQLSPESLSGDGELSPVSIQIAKSALDAELVSTGARLQMCQDDLDEDSVFSEYDRRLEAHRRGRLISFGK